MSENTEIDDQTIEGVTPPRVVEPPKKVWSVNVKIGNQDGNTNLIFETSVFSFIDAIAKALGVPAKDIRVHNIIGVYDENTYYWRAKVNDLFFTLSDSKVVVQARLEYDYREDYR